jgi:PHD/YefM family antitoxin component YafN of YafNO toxin-antitoxin module
VITQNGRPAGVLLSPDEYDDLVYRKSFMDSVNRGFEDVDQGKFYSTEQLKEMLSQKKSSGNKK